jgi:hypothetical protein
LSGEVPLNEVVFHDDRLDADVLMGEKSRANAADLFSSERFREFLTRAQQADAILFTVAWDRTHRSQVTAALREFESVNLRVAGIALAQIDPKGMRRYGYGGKYGAYAGYGKGYYEAG